MRTGDQAVEVVDVVTSIEKLGAAAEREPVGAVRRPVRYTAGIVALSAVAIACCGAIELVSGPAGAAGTAGVVVCGGLLRVVRARQLLAAEWRERVR